MVRVSVESDRLVFEVQGMDKLWALRSRLEIPIEHVKSVRLQPDTKMGWFDGVKLGGTGLPGIFRAGTFFQEGGLIFWDVRHPERALAIDLDHEHYKRLIIEVEQPEQTADMITSLIANRAR